MRPDFVGGVVIITVELPYERLQVCEICGATGRIDDFAKEHRVPRVGYADVEVGEKVRLSLPHYKSGRIIREIWVVTRLFYAASTLDDIFFPPNHGPKLHELCVALRHPRRKKRCSFELRYSDFELVREGDKNKLIKHGLVKKRK